MLALRKVKHGTPELVLQEVAEPVPSPGHVVIDVAAAGICGTDLHIMKDEYRSRPPVTLGHELAGVVSAVGGGVTRWRVGQRVVTETYYSVCGRCKFCRTGRPNLCQERSSIGSFCDGGFAARALVPETSLHALPSGVGFPEAALMEPLACVVRGLVELNRIDAGDRVLITGPGTIGMLALQLARASGGRVVMLGSERDARRLDLASILGAAAALAAPTEEEISGLVTEQLGGPPNLVIECSGAADAGRLLLELVERGGRYVQVGLYGQPLTFDLDALCYKELVMTGSFATAPGSWYRALDLVAAGAVNLHGLVGGVFALSSWREAFAAVAAGAPGKTFLVPDGSELVRGPGSE